MHRVDLVNAFYHRFRFVRCDQKHRYVDAPNHQDAVFAFHLAGDVSRQTPVAGIDLARFQRTSEGSEHSTRS